MQSSIEGLTKFRIRPSFSWGNLSGSARTNEATAREQRGESELRLMQVAAGRAPCFRTVRKLRLRGFHRVKSFVSHRRSLFLLAAIASCGFLPGNAAGATSAPPAVGSKLVSLQTSPQSSVPPQTPIPGLPKSEPAEQQHGKTEQYTLSEDRYEKAVAYSRAGYTLY